MVMCLLRWLAWVLVLAAPCLATATTAIIYQPQQRDMQVAQDQWPKLFAKLRADGFDTLVFQWTQFGKQFSTPADHAWLLQRVHEANDAGLHIVLGLASDPDFFKTQNEKQDAALTAYLSELSRQNARVAKHWVGELGSDMVAGWYLPMEIDDVRWNDPKARELLGEYLSLELRQLNNIAPRPVYVTSFFAGHMSPDQYADLVADVQRRGVHAWVQDGAGTHRLEPAERNLYLASTSQCQKVSANGVVFEIFEQTGTDKAFTAAALKSKEAASALAQRAPCGGDSVFFELRYLPDAQQVLQR
jgi:hypothetical protein